MSHTAELVFFMLQRCQMSLEGLQWQAEAIALSCPLLTIMRPHAAFILETATDVRV